MKIETLKSCLDTLFIPTVKTSLWSSPLRSSEHIQLGIQKHWRNTWFTAKFHESQEKCSILSSEKQIYFIFQNGKTVVTKTLYAHRIYRSFKNLLLQPFTAEQSRTKPNKTVLRENFLSFFKLTGSHVVLMCLRCEWYLKWMSQSEIPRRRF